MLGQLIVGAAVSAVTIVIHALVMATVVRVAHTINQRKKWLPPLHLSVVMVATVFVLMLAHIAEVVVWSLAYVLVGAAPPGADPLYFALVNYTTLGYGDILPAEGWRLLGPLTAMDGILLFGWSTAVIFAVLRKTMLPEEPTADVE